MNEKPEKYLDKLLTILAENFGQNITVDKLINLIGSSNYDVHFDNQLVEINRALDFLKSENLIHFNPDSSEVSISYNGYIKLKTNSFKKESRDKTVNKYSQILAWLAPLIISIISLCISVYQKNSCENCNNEQIKKCPEKTNKITEKKYNIINLKNNINKDSISNKLHEKHIIK